MTTIKQLFKKLIFLFLVVSIIGCATTSSTALQKAQENPIKTIMVATNLKEDPIVNYLGVTIFENKVSYLTDFDFNPGLYVIEKADSALHSRGFATIVMEYPISEQTILGLATGIFGTRAARRPTVNQLAAQGAEALLLIEQGYTQTGISYNHGSSITEHGLILVRTFFGRKDRVEIPVLVNFIDLRTGKVMFREEFMQNEVPIFRDDFEHITTADHLAGSDRQLLKKIYTERFDSIIVKCVSNIK